MAPAKSPRRVRVERGIYRQPNSNYAVCARHAGRLHFRTVGHDIEAARRAREELVTALAAGRLPASPRLRFDTVAGWWLERFEAKVAAGDRHPRTLEAHRHHLEHNLLPRLASRRIAALGVEEVAALITELHADGRSAKSTANALGTLQGILRFARRRGWVLTDPVELLEPEERPRHPRRRQRVLGRPEIGRLLDACPPRGRLLVTTALYSGLRISELLGLIWEDVDFAAGLIRVRAQLSHQLAAHKQASPFAMSGDWVFATARGTPYGHRNVARRVLTRAADAAQLNGDGWPPLRFHDLRHTFASHLIVDLGLDVAQVSRILGHSRITITLDTYTHLFDDRRHTEEIRRRMADSQFAGLLASDSDKSQATVLPLQAPEVADEKTS